MLINATYLHFDHCFESEQVDKNLIFSDFCYKYCLFFNETYSYSSVGKKKKFNMKLE